MFIYFLLIRIAAFFGHPKARLMVQGQKEIKDLPRNAVWIHASSVGEFEQARPLIEKLKKTNSNLKIVVTFFSPSGYEMRKNYAQADVVLYLPFATRRNAKRFMDKLQPKMAIFVKYEFWPAYLRELKKRAIPTYSICAIFREKQLFFRWYGRSYLRLLKCFTNIYVQDEASRDLLAAHGIHHVTVAGDTRFDRVQDIMNSLKGDVSRAGRLTPVAEFTKGCERVIVAGSTWPKDEELLAKYMAASKERIEANGTKLILVPHEIDAEHLHYIFNLFRGRMVRYTDVQREDAQCSKLSIQNILQQADVLVIDTMGLLSSIYRFGHVGYIGGGFGVGIHNTIEAAVYGIPVIFGPNYHHFREAKGLITSGAARSISNYKEIEAALDTALANHQEIGMKAAEYVAAETGATEKICKEVFDI